MLRRSILLLGAAFIAGCQAVPASPTSQVPPTFTSTATMTVTVTHEVTTTLPAVTVTPPPRTVTETVAAGPSRPIDVTYEYLAWRRAHRPADDADGAAVVQAFLSGGALDVLTNHRPPGWGWNCDGEPSRIAGDKLLTIRILNNDGSVFRYCPPGV